MEKILTRINRISAYILLVLVLLILITGYRQVGFFTRGLANSLHQIYLNIAGLIVGSVHILMSIRKALIRNKIKGIWVNIILIILGVAIAGGFSYFTFL